MGDEGFKFFLPLSLVKSEDKNGEWRIRGIASTGDPDLQGEVVKQNGLDISVLQEGRGLFNVDHLKGPENVIGKVDFAKQTPEGLYVEGYLFKHQERAKAFYNILRSLKKTDAKRVQLSIEGKIQKRGGKDSKTIARARVDKVALTLDPVNPNTYAELAKSLFTVSDSSGHSPGEETGETSSTPVSDTAVKKADVKIIAHDVETAEVPLAQDEKPKLTSAEKKEVFKVSLKQIVKNWIRDGVEYKGLDNKELKRHVRENVHDDVIRRSAWDKLFLEGKRAAGFDDKQIDELVNKLNLESIRKEIDRYSRSNVMLGAAFAMSRKADKKINQALNKVEKALAIGAANYATTLPQNMRGGTALTRESLDTKKKKRKEALKAILKSLKNTYPYMEYNTLVAHAFEILKKKLNINVERRT